MSIMDADLQEAMAREDMTKRYGPAYNPLKAALTATDAAIAHLKRTTDAGLEGVVLEVTADALSDARVSLNAAISQLEQSAPKTP